MTTQTTTAVAAPTEEKKEGMSTGAKIAIGVGVTALAAAGIWGALKFFGGDAGETPSLPLPDNNG